jgi:hypothetical protein
MGKNVSKQTQRGRNHSAHDIGSVFVPPEQDQLAIYRQSKNLHINQSDLKLELIHFAKAIENKLNTGLLVGIISVWIAIFTGEFHDTFGIKSDYIRIAVILLAVISTFYVIKSIFLTLYRAIVSFYFFRKLFKADEWIDENEINAENKAESIIEKCETK